MCAILTLLMRANFQHGWGSTNHSRFIFAYVDLRLLDTHILRVTSKYNKGLPRWVALFIVR